jgi:hypothetical protein
MVTTKPKPAPRLYICGVCGACWTAAEYQMFYGACQRFKCQGGFMVRRPANAS